MRTKTKPSVAVKSAAPAVISRRAKISASAPAPATTPPVGKRRPQPSQPALDVPLPVSNKLKPVKANGTARKAPPTKPKPAPEAVRVVNAPVFVGGELWRMSGRNGVAYIKDAALAGELLATDPKNLAKAAMAVYYDRKGKAFAWQVRFDTDRWDEVMRRLG